MGMGETLLYGSLAVAGGYIFIYHVLPSLQQGQLGGQFLPPGGTFLPPVGAAPSTGGVPAPAAAAMTPAYCKSLGMVYYNDRCMHRNTPCNNGKGYLGQQAGNTGWGICVPYGSSTPAPSPANPTPVSTPTYCKSLGMVFYSNRCMHRNSPCNNGAGYLGQQAGNTGWGVCVPYGTRAPKTTPPKQTNTTLVPRFGTSCKCGSGSPIAVGGDCNACKRYCGVKCGNCTPYCLGATSV